MKGERRSVSRILSLLVTEEGSDHSSGHAVTSLLKRPNPEGEWNGSCPEGPLLFGLAPSGVYPTAFISEGAGELLPHLFTLALRTERKARNREFLFSVASRSPSRGERSFFCGTFPASQRAVVSGHPVPRSPDFPRASSDLHARSLNLLSPTYALGGASCSGLRTKMRPQCGQ